MGGEQSKIDTTKVVPPATHCHFSMKILIKGDYSTGKTSLFNRLQRKRFTEEHQSTQQSTKAAIEWEFPMSGFRVNIEVWDVVDGKRKQQGEQLKIKSDVNKKDDFYGEGRPELDVETQKLIENTSGVIFLVNPFKKHTLDYVKRVVPALPEDMDVLIILNFKDIEDDKRVVSLNDVMLLAADLGDKVKFCEASMLNSFGIKAIKSFLNIPYIKAERTFLTQKLQSNEENSGVVEDEFQKTFQEQDYKFYKEWLSKTMKERLEMQKKNSRWYYCGCYHLFHTTCCINYLRVKRKTHH